MFAKVIALVALFVLCMVAHVWWYSMIQPDVTADMYLRQMGPTATNEVAQQVRAWHHAQQYPGLVVWGVFVLGALGIFVPDIYRLLNSSANAANKGMRVAGESVDRWAKGLDK